MSGITVKLEPFGEWPAHLMEMCCFCRSATSYWAVAEDVACCKACARIHKDSDLPSKAEWWAKERALTGDDES